MINHNSSGQLDSNSVTPNVSDLNQTNTAPNTASSQGSGQAYSPDLNKSAANKKDSKILFLLLITGSLLLVVGVVGTAVFAGQYLKSQQNNGVNSPTSTPTPSVMVSPTQILENSKTSYEVILKKNSDDASKSDVYIKSEANDRAKFFKTISNVYAQHYHPAEYINGHLYIIRRIGYDGYNDTDWSDEVWKYTSKDDEGTKLYTDKGIDFRVKDDESLIAVAAENAFVILDKDSNILKSFDKSDLTTNTDEVLEMRPLDWGVNEVWLGNSGLTLLELTKINASNFSVKKYDLSDLDIGAEYALSPSAALLAFSDYPLLLDADVAKQFNSSNTDVHLYVYDLQTGKKQLIATAKTKKFEPVWIDDATLEYNDPDTGERIQKTVNS